MLSLENVDINQYVMLLHHTNALQESLGDYHASTPRNFNFRESSQPSIEQNCEKKKSPTTVTNNVLENV